MKKSLLEKAKAFKTIDRRKAIYPDDEVELACAYIKGEVSAVQVGKALVGRTRQYAYQWAMPRLRQAYKEGKIIIK